MLRRIGLALACLLLSMALYAQADSLDATVLPDSMANTADYTSKNEILSWIAEHKEAQPGSIDPIIFPDAIRNKLYRLEYNYLSRPTLPMPRLYGFTQPLSYFSPGSYHGAYNTFYPQQLPLNQGYGTLVYPFTPALSAINGGMGEYEHHFAKVAFMKNTLFGIPELYYQGDLLAANGLWADLTTAETSHHHYLAIPLGEWQLNADYASWNRDVSMLELLPVYWRSTNFTLTQHLHHQYLALGNSKLELAYLHRSEEATATALPQALESASTQLKVAHKLDCGTWKYQIAYEHKWQDESNKLKGMFEADNYKDQLSFNWDSYPVIGLNLDLQIRDWNRTSADAELMLPVHGSYLGLRSHLRVGKNRFTPYVDDIYNPGTQLKVIDDWTRQEHIGLVRIEYYGLSTILEGGIKQLRQDTVVPGLDKSEYLNVARLSFELDQKWRNWQIEANPSWSWTQQRGNLCENPEFSFASLQNLTYHLPWGNSLQAGFQVQGHSGYYAANALSLSLIEGSTVCDAWLGVGIEDRFNFHVGLKNLLSSSIYGSAPAPVSLFADLSWYYLN